LDLIASGWKKEETATGAACFIILGRRKEERRGVRCKV